MGGGPMERMDWLLITIGASGSRGLTPVRLQKSLFLLAQTLPKKERNKFYRFIPYNYGPFCVDIYRDAQFLEQSGLVEIRRASGRWPDYYLTPQGQTRAQELRAGGPRKRLEYIDRVVEAVLSLSFPELVKAIYQAYPQFKKNSVFVQ